MSSNAQTQEYCNKYEILDRCLANETIMKLSGDDIDLIKVKIRKYMNACPDRKILVEPATDRSVSCILAANVDALIDKVLGELKELNRKKKPARCAQKKAKAVANQTQKAQIKTVEQPNPVFKTALKPVLIRKYIPQQLWKEICKACGKGNTDKQMFVLKTIASVNVNVVETPQIDGFPIINPVTRVQTMSSYMKHEDGQSLVQSIDSSWVTDNKRIIWTYLPDEKVLVCTGCCPDHNANKRENLKYSRIRDLAAVGQNAKGEKITLQKIKDEEYFNIGVLFEQLLSETDLETCIEQEQTAATHTGKTEENEVAQTPFDPEDITAVKAIQTYYHAIIKTIEETANQELLSASSEQNLVKKLKTIDAAREALIEKATLENLMTPKLQKICSLLKGFQDTNSK